MQHIDSHNLVHIITTMDPPFRNHAAQPRLRRHSAALKCMAMVLLGLLVLTSIIILTIYLAVQPKKLSYSIEKASINGYRLTPDNHLDADFHFLLRATNPKRRISLYYDRIAVTVSYEGQRLAVNNNFQPFYQPRRNVTRLQMDVVARNVTVYGAASRDLQTETGSGSVNLVMEMRVKMRLKVGPFKVHRKIKVVCGAMKVPIYASPQIFDRVFCEVDD